jgi:cytochrome c-type biogenesis protein
VEQVAKFKQEDITMTEIPTAESPMLSKPKLNLLLHSLIFVLGFSIIFVVGWGGATTLLGGIFFEYKNVIAKIGGLVVILFGLATMGVVKIPWFYYDTRPEWQGNRNNSFISSGFMGVFFAAGWSPCIGATLGAILTLAYAQETSSQAMLLSGFYSVGLGLPFIVIGLGIERATKIVQKLTRYIRPIQIISGVFLILIGIMILTNQIILIAIWAQRNGLFLDLPLGTASVPTIFAAFTAGLLSFLSPCVLPLVPAYLGYMCGQAIGWRSLGRNH